MRIVFKNQVIIKKNVKCPYCSKKTNIKIRIFKDHIEFYCENEKKITTSMKYNEILESPITIGYLESSLEYEETQRNGD